MYKTYFDAYPCNLFRKVAGYSSDSVVQIPCGKCPECMKKKQNALRIRCYNEAKKRGVLHFLTLTYSDEALPFSRVLLSASEDTGEISISGDIELLNRFDVPRPVIDAIMSDKVSIYHAKMRFCDVPALYRDGNCYFYRYLPCHDYRAVKRLFKLARKWYVLKYTNPLDFSYLVVPEFGERFLAVRIFMSVYLVARTILWSSLVVPGLKDFIVYLLKLSGLYMINCLFFLLSIGYMVRSLKTF